MLLVATYEMGHQPLSLARVAAALRLDGHVVRVLDLSIDEPDDEAFAWAAAVAVSVPMHTAMRLAIALVRQLRRNHPDLAIALFGLYAGVSRAETSALDLSVIETPSVDALRAWIDGVPGVVDFRGRAAGAPDIAPDREGLPPLERYARLERDGGLHLAGYVEATTGCAHRCRHCPVPVVHDGRVHRVDSRIVVQDALVQVAAGARHITFGDPDFLNAPTHAMQVVRALHDAAPHATFDVTVKVEHIIREASRWAELASLGCLFVVSAFESTDDHTLRHLDKGHTAADLAIAVEILRSAGIDVRPTFVPFTPWTELHHLADLLDFVTSLDLVDAVDPVQYGIRLLVPDGSLLLREPDTVMLLGAYDAAALTWTWSSRDPAVDELQRTLAAIAARAADGASAAAAFPAIDAAIRAAAGVPVGAIPAGATTGRPRMTEPWFC